MSKFSKKFFVLALVGYLTVSFAGTSFAAEGENSLTAFFRKLFNYPGNTVKGTAEMTGNTLSNAGEKVVAATGENTAAVLQGDIAKTGDLVVEPVQGTLETTGQAVAETVQVPVEAANDQL